MTPVFVRARFGGIDVAIGTAFLPHTGGPADLPLHWAAAHHPTVTGPSACSASDAARTTSSNPILPRRTSGRGRTSQKASAPNERVPGVVKITKPHIQGFSQLVVRLTGAAESSPPLGLVLPAAVDGVPVFTPPAATGLAVLMAPAASYHARRKESAPIATTAVLLILAAIVMGGRFGPHTF